MSLSSLGQRGDWARIASSPFLGEKGRESFPCKEGLATTVDLVKHIFEEIDEVGK
jgi:hypothetical protein